MLPRCGTCIDLQGCRLSFFESLPSRGELSKVNRRFMLLVAFSAGVAFAQKADEPKTPAPDVDASKVSDPDKLKNSGEGLVRMRSALKDVLGKLEEARSTKDVVKLTCVNEKLTQIKGLLRISETADVNLQEAVARKETATSEHEYTKVSIAQSKVLQLRAEAEQCMGQLAFRVDENLNVEVETPEYLPKGDPTLLPPTLTLVNVRPVPASPTTAP